MDANQEQVVLDWERWNTVDEEVSGRAISFSDNIYNMYDIWSKDPNKVCGNTRPKKPQTVNIAGHDVVMYRLVMKPAKKK